MPDSLLFDGAADQIVVGRGSVNGAGARTFMVVAKFSADGSAYRNFFGIDGVDSWWGTDNAASRHLAAYSGIGAPAISSTITTPSSDGWCIYGFSMPNDGEARMHKYVYSTATWTHEQVTGGFISDPTMSAAFRLGCTGVSNQFFPGNLLAIGIWDSELSDGTIETLPSGLAAWTKTAPAEVWRLDRTSTITSVAGTSCETSRVGTSLDTGDAPAGWTDLPVSPLTGLLDNFNRADELPIASAAWTSPAYSAGTYGEQALAVFSNQLAANGAGNATGYWDLTQFAADQEVWMTVATKPVFGSAHLLARMQGVGTASATMYVWRLETSGQFDLYSVVANTANFLTSGSFTYTSGDQMRLTCQGTTITGWHKPVASSIWRPITSTTNSDVTGVGYIGVMANDSQQRLDNFGGGSLPVASGKLIAALSAI